MIRFIEKLKDIIKKPPPIDGRLLEAHLRAIKVCLVEILAYDRKKVTTNPTYHHWLPVDIEETWVSSEELLHTTFQLLCKTASELHVSHESIETWRGMKECLAAYIAMIDQITYHIHNTHETRQLSNQQLQVIDNEILQVQHAINRVHKHITKDFTYSAQQSSRQKLLTEKSKTGSLESNGGELNGLPKGY